MRGIDDFGYLLSVAKKYGSLYLLDEINSLLDNINEKQITDLRIAYELIEDKNDSERINLWIQECSKNRYEKSYQEFVFSREVAKLFVLFYHLGDRKLSPFSSYRVCLTEEPRTPEWKNLPTELQFLRVPAERYANDSQSSTMTVEADPSGEDFRALAKAAEVIKKNGYLKTINSWLDRFDMQEHEEAWLIYNLLGVFDRCDLSLE
jgi:hypothetical protein